ncbi:hypothetical protein QR680_005763 [Steinernema hermaphroditum]|uniref:Uncharacterized protein n=1 Tax=Steinernema hermaphroditum TaxID=289476 RepID=A0AA39HUM2_9BILA|nr:hypothetical protein QR680_005763 [Steinernema hermaphroditum]
MLFADLLVVIYSSFLPAPSSEPQIERSAAARAVAPRTLPTTSGSGFGWRHRRNILVMRFSLFLLALFAVGLVALASACDIIVHVKSDTDKKFSAQVLAPNGKKSDKWNYSHKKERNTFQQKASECGLKDWEISTFENGKLNSTVKVSLNGIGRVTYLVGDNLIPTMKDRQGAICNGQCAPLSPK